MITKYPNEGKVIAKTFDFNTAIAGYKCTANSCGWTFKVAKAMKLNKGSVYAAAKVNNEWVSIAVQKE